MLAKIVQALATPDKQLFLIFSTASALFCSCKLTFDNPIKASLSFKPKAISK